MTQPDIADATADSKPPMSAPLAPAEEAAPQSPPSAGAPDPILAMIERASRDPAVDIEKFERLMAMKERVEAQRASIIFAEAFAELQPDLPVIDRSGTIVVYSKTDREKHGGVPAGAQPIQQTPYATLDDIIEALRKPLHAHGFSLRFEYETIADGKLATTAFLRHRGGHEISAKSPPLQHDSTGSKNNVQAVGSSLTYGRRYALMAVVPIVSHAPQDADDDGKAAGAALIDADQLVKVQELLEETKSDVAVFFDTLGASGFSDMTVAQWKRGVALLNEKKRRTAKKAASP
jgi:hypothetical protein